MAVAEAACSDEEPSNCPMEEPAVTSDHLRPAYHLTPPAGWMNDPCGLIYHAGQWHLFYQYNPSIAIWGGIHWGHAVSTDLVTWTHLPPALKPDAQLGMIFTGSAVLDRDNTSGLCAGKDGCLVAIYTHALGKSGKEMQSIAASSDGGKTWTPHKGNPVIPNPGVKDFRDPRVLWHAGSKRWVMVLAAGDRAPIYASIDLKSWTKVGDFGPIPSLAKGAIWECPELFTLASPDGKGQRWVLKIDLNMGMGKEGSHGRYWLGSFDGEAFTVTGAAGGARMDWGEDFYAAQTFSEAPDGRKVWIGWMNSWMYALMTPTSGWRGAMSIPRELSLIRQGGQDVLVQRPSPEVLKLRGGCGPILSTGESALSGESTALAGITDTALELVLELELDAATEVGVRLQTDGAGNSLVVGYDAGKAQLFVDRRKAGNTAFHANFAAKHTAPLKLTGGKLKLRIFLDRSTLEVFANGGQAVISDTVYPNEGAQKMGLYSKGAARLKMMEVYSLNGAL